MTLTFPRPIGFLMFLALTAGMIAMLLPAVDLPLSAHAISRHGEQAVNAKQCLQRPDAETYFNPATRRTAVICWLGERWGIVILDAALLIYTAFVTNKHKSRQSVVEYLKRKGYEREVRH